ncbi:hypothetical protein BLA60_33955 [Actinophytocola xinjiangensis]|uniref:NHL repeat-containing protein n=1 Tax=Actinophytocola xinjiangensis TaxID=485602 RepID=A0A7Z0WGJ3_9PSEU|nr:hypothetical protein [Actinophytocola xinjiangensis]OLF06046.1 hypothetical protein BLA60_33955 [Actinophytocola xinjiangensis]
MAGIGGVRVLGQEGQRSSVGPNVFDPGDVAVGPGGEVYLAAGGRVLRLNGDGPPDVEVPPGADPWAGQDPGELLTVAGQRDDPGRLRLNVPVSDLAIGTDGSLYLATSFGLHTVTPDGTIETDLPDLRDTITRLAVDAHGNVYLASADKVQVLVRPRETSASWRWIVAGLAILAAIAGGVLVRRRMVSS